MRVDVQKVVTIKVEFDPRELALLVGFCGRVDLDAVEAVIGGTLLPPLDTRDAITKFYDMMTDQVFMPCYHEEARNLIEGKKL